MKKAKAKKGTNTHPRDLCHGQQRWRLRNYLRYYGRASRKYPRDHPGPGKKYGRFAQFPPAVAGGVFASAGKKKRSQRFQDAPDPGGHSKRSGRLRRSTTPDSKSGFLKSALARRRWTTNLKTCRQIWKMLENISSNGGGATFERRKKRRPWAPLVDTWNRTLVSPSRKVVVFFLGGERPRERNGPQQQRGAAAG